MAALAAGCSDADAPEAPAVLGITVTGARASIRVGESFQVTANVETRGPIAKTVTFASSNVGTATVSSADGLTATIVGVSAGATTITVTSTADRTKTSTLSLDVKREPSVRLTPAIDSLRPGQIGQLSLSVDVDPGVSTAVTMFSRNESVVTIDQTGKLTAIAAGETHVGALLAADLAVGDSTLVVVVDPCLTFPTITLGTTFTGAITGGSCRIDTANGPYIVERIAYVVPEQSVIGVAVTADFPAQIGYLLEGRGPGTDIDAGSTVDAFTAIVAPGRYTSLVWVTDPATRGSFSLRPHLATLSDVDCFVFVTTGIVAADIPLLPLCTFTPENLSPGAYNYRDVIVTPAVMPSDSITVTVTSQAFTPLIEAYIGSETIRSTATTGNTASLTFQGVDGSVVARIGNRDPGLTGPVSVTVTGPSARSFRIP